MGDIVFFSFLSIQVDLEALLLARIKAATEGNLLLYTDHLVDAMKEGKLSAVVVEKGMEAVASLCEQRDDRAEANRVMFGMTLSGIPLLLEVMREHKGSEEIARVSFLAVWYLSRNEDIKRIVGESGGIPLLLEMLEEHGKRNVEVAKNGVTVLHNLSINNDNRKRIAEAGGIAMILSMMEEHGASNVHVAKEGCMALTNLANNNDDNRKRIGEVGGIAMILRMMEVHGASNAEVAKNGCVSLWNLAFNNTDNKRKILAANGVSMVERMKSTWASNADVQTNADGALGKLR